MKEILSDNYATTRLAHAAAVAAKEFVVENGRVIMALNDAGAGDETAFVFKADVLRVPKPGDEAWDAFDKIYFDAAANNFTVDAAAGANTLAGQVLEAAAVADVEGIIELNPHVNT